MTLLDDARALSGDLTDLRHRLHRLPEIGLQLPRTQETVLSAIDGLGLEISIGTSSTSVTAVLRGTAPAVIDLQAPPVVLLRGDMDALPVHEMVDVPFRSNVDGAMHACGHDLHTSMLVGAARTLAAHRDELVGDVVFMFQPGEEGFDGAGHMIAEGVLDAAGRRPEAAFALHVMSNLTGHGTVATRAGTLMAASDGLFVTVRGRGGHGSSPHTAKDPVPAACEMVLALQTAMTRSVDAFAPAVLTVGTFHAGTKRNIIPDTVTFEATVRTFDPAVRAVIARLCERVCKGVAAAHGVQVEVSYLEEYPVTVNDGKETRFALDVVADLLGRETALSMPNPIAGSEDFSRVIAEVPGAMLFLGALVDGRDSASAHPNHSAKATFDDGVMPAGSALLATLAARRLAATTPR
ncbi:MAG TPA: M20 family metallopeptidase [Kineosporiaceae bacterium]|jgi:amidohydrolase|nr:M20 family metallopeptidase [Kineosporiaceae bacterium]